MYYHGILKESRGKFFRFASLELLFNDTVVTDSMETENCLKNSFLSDGIDIEPFDHQSFRLPSEFTPKMPSN